MQLIQTKNPLCERVLNFYRGNAANFELFHCGCRKSPEHVNIIDHASVLRQTLLC